MIKKTLHSRAYYIDTFSQESAHEMFNSSLILMCSMVFDNVECKLSKSSLNAFKDIINAKVPVNVNFNTISVIAGESRLKLILRYLFSAIQNVRFLVLSPKKSILIYPFNNLFSLRLLNFVNKFYKRKIVIFCHGEMEGIINDLKGKGILHRVLTWLSRNFFLNQNLKISEGVYFSIMGDALKDNLSKILPSPIIEKFICIDHPYIFEDIEVKAMSNGELLHIGTVGTLNKIKGLERFVSFVSKIAPSVKEKVHISVTGRVSGNIEVLNDLDIDIVPQNRSLSRKDFKERVNQLDLFLFFYPKDSYRVTASGAIMDAIFHEKPILALKNEYFEYIFQKFGQFGYLTDDVDEMAARINNIDAVDENKEIDFKKLKDKFTPKTISLQLSSELSRIGYLNR